MVVTRDQVVRNRRDQAEVANSPANAQRGVAATNQNAGTPRPNTGNNPPGASVPGSNPPAQNQPGNNPPVQKQSSDIPIDQNQAGNNPPPSSSSGSNQSQILPPMHIPPPSVNMVNNPPPPIVQNIISAPNLAIGTHPPLQSSVNLPSTSQGNGSQPPPPLAFNLSSTSQGVGNHSPPPQMQVEFGQNRVDRAGGGTRIFRRGIDRGWNGTFRGRDYPFSRGTAVGTRAE
ncbi:abl interactor homolog [Leptopilina boulardi]|uniref:abl interactor homolog n=1 Tax=Leptopilina boulardi TaxID=63433 RepID=UPI0021F5D122|nr:abl interactor homolog [Leptopilina boulardi]